MSKIPTNLNLQQIQQAQTNAITDLLQAPNQFGTQKTLINVNGANSKLTTGKNGIIKYTLENPIKLDIGHRVTLVQSFIEERGLSEGTITIDEDIEEEMRFLYYKQGDLENTQSGVGAPPFTSDIAADVKYAAFPNWATDISPGQYNVNTYKYFNDGSLTSTTYAHQSLTPSSNYVNTGQGSSTTGQVDGIPNNAFGANGAYYYLMEWFNPFETGNSSSFVLSGTSPQGDATSDPKNIYQVNKAYPRPLYGQVTLNIPAGNYSVSALSNLINQQLNGNGGYGDQFNRNPFINKCFHNTDSSGFKMPLPMFDDLFDTYSQTQDIDASIYNPDSLIIGEDSHQPYQRRRGNIITKVYYNSQNTQNQVNMDICRSKATNTGNFKYADNSTLIGDHIFRGLGATRMLVTDDDNIFEQNSPDRVKFRQFQSNFYLAIQGLNALFKKGYYYDSDQSDITKFEASFFPTLADFFLGNVGDQGLYYLNQDTSQLNYRPDGNDRRIYPSDDVEAIFKFSMLFPIIATSQGLDASVFSKNPDGADTPYTFNYDLYKAIGQGKIAQFAGTTAFNLEYDEGDTNRFSITNLHEPYKLPNLSPDGKTNTNFGGQQATMINTPVFFSYGGIENAQESIQKPFNQGQYPVECVSGCAVNNFAFKTVQSTQVFKDLVEKIQQNNIGNARNQLLREKLIFDLFTKPFEKFYSSADAATKAWNTTIWARLGFTYSQLGDITSNLETVFTPSNDNQGAGLIPNKEQHIGIISHNEFSFSYIPSTDGMGIGNFYVNNTNGQPQGYGLRSYSNYKSEAGTGATDKIEVFGYAQNYIHILSNSQKLIAENFPALNGGNNYLVIESDIVKENAQDSNSTPTTIIGIVSTENASNDTIFSQNNYTFTITEPKLLSSIEVRIKNPDGTLVSDDVIGKNNGFVFLIEKPFEPAAMELQSI